jgi:nicotinate-nucleotide pyrophosphorylase (carboxylating)
MLPLAAYQGVVEAALAEDIGSGDLTTECTVPETQRVTATIVAKAPGVLAGREVAAYVFTRLSSECHCEGLNDGTRVVPGTSVLELRGPARAVLAGERVALNFLQHLSGIASLTRQFVDAVAGTGAVISDTRKTTPLLRGLEKYAVRCGGGTNHRSRLDAMLLVKENHIAAAGSLPAALERALESAAPRGLEVEIEVQSWEEFEMALPMQPQRILLDHWDPAAVERAVRRRGSARRPLLEVSGNLSLETVRVYAECGADILSVGALTHSAPALDLSLLVQDAPA